MRKWKDIEAFSCALRPPSEVQCYHCVDCSAFRPTCRLSQLFPSFLQSPAPSSDSWPVAWMSASKGRLLQFWITEFVWFGAVEWISSVPLEGFLAVESFFMVAIGPHEAIWKVRFNVITPQKYSTTRWGISCVKSPCLRTSIHLMRLYGESSWEGGRILSYRRRPRIGEECLK